MGGENQGPLRGSSAAEEAFWSGLDADVQRQVVAAMRPRKIMRGETLIEGGAEADALFVVDFGLFLVIGAATGRPVAHIGAGQLIGEMGFFAHAPRSATVVAVRDSQVLEISRAEFDALCVRLPELHGAVSRSLAARLRAMALAAAQSDVAPRAAPARVVAIVGAGGAPVPEAFIAALRSQSKLRVRVRVVGVAEAAAQGGGHAFDGFAVANWLSAEERGHDLLMCIADPDLAGWTQIALRAADQLVVVATGDPAAPGAVEQLGFKLFPPARRRLVLLHERRGPHVGAIAPWLRGRETFMVHHVCLQDGADVARLMRFLLGRAVGLVAGGGGGYGPAHVGIVEAFSQRGIEFDICGGSSVGSVMAAAFAALMPFDDIARRLDDAFIRNRALRRVTWPKYGFLDHSVLDEQLQAIFGDALIEDLWKPYFAMATDLSTFSARLLRSGGLWQAIRASIAIPGALPPYFDPDGHMLVDGGVVDNVPLAAMKEVASGVNVVIDLRPQTRRTYDVPYASIPGRRALLAHFGNPLNWSLRLPECPSPASVIQYAMFANFQECMAVATETDLLLRPPPFPGSHMLNWDRHAEVLAASRAWGLQAIDTLTESGDPALAALRAALA